MLSYRCCRFKAFSATHVGCSNHLHLVAFIYFVAGDTMQILSWWQVCRYFHLGTSEQDFALNTLHASHGLTITHYLPLDGLCNLTIHIYIDIATNMRVFKQPLGSKDLLASCYLVLICRSSWACL